MKTLEKWKKAAEKMNLTLMGLTGSATGYPEPDEGWFAHGFDDFEAAEKFAEEHGGTIVRGEWRDGWSYATNRGTEWKPFNTIDMIDEDAKIMRDCPDDYWEFYGYEDATDMRESYACKFGLDEADPELDEILKTAENNFKELGPELAKVDFNNELIVIDDDYFDICSLKSMNYSEDTHNYAIGVAWLFSEEYDYEEME